MQTDQAKAPAAVAAAALREGFMVLHDAKILIPRAGPAKIPA